MKSVEQIAARDNCSIRQVNMTISLAFLAPELVQAVVEGRLPCGIDVTRLRDAPGRQICRSGAALSRGANLCARASRSTVLVDWVDRAAFALRPVAAELRPVLRAEWSRQYAMLGLSI